MTNQSDNDKPSKLYRAFVLLILLFFLAAVAGIFAMWIFVEPPAT